MKKMDESFNKELLRYGNIIKDIERKDGTGYYRARTIEYEGHKYFHTMLNGETTVLRIL